MVNRFSSYSLIEKEFKKVGLETKDATIEKLMAEISRVFLREYADRIDENENYSLSEFKETELYQVHYVLLNHLNEVGFYLYDYKEEIMPKKIKDFYTQQLNT